MMIRHFKTLTVCLFLALFGSNQLAFAAGGGAIGGGGGGFSNPPPPKKTPLELAISNYNKGIKHRDKAWSLEEKSKQADSDKKKTKLERKAQKEFTKAVKKFKTAIKHEPKLYEAHSSLGYALRRVGEYDESLAAYDTSLALNPRYAEAIEYRGETYLALQRYKETQDAYVKLMQLDREKANQLMAAIQEFLSTTDINKADSSLIAFKAWADDRLALADQTRDLSGIASSGWE